MNRVELKTFRESLERQLKTIGDVEPVCARCEHFSAQRICSKFGAVPEDQIYIDFNCPEWAFDGVPF